MMRGGEPSNVSNFSYLRSRLYTTMYLEQKDPMRYLGEEMAGKTTDVRCQMSFRLLDFING